MYLITSNLLLVLAICHGAPVNKGTSDNIGPMILPSEPSLPILSETSRQDIIPPTQSQAGGIASSQLGYIQVARVGSGLSLPPVPGINFKLTLKGSVTHTGFKSEVIEKFINERASQYSTMLRDYLSDEREEMKKRSSKGFFWFFQSAANYGYSKTDRTRDILASSDFAGLSKDTQSVMETTSQRTLTASYDTILDGTTTGVGGVIEAFAYLYINRITMDSGKIFDVVQENPEMTVADKNGDVIGTTETGSVELISDGGNIGETVLNVLPKDPERFLKEEPVATLA